MPRTRSKTATTKSKSGADKSTALTHERIQADLEAFRKAGGRIEKLGNTRVLQKINIEETTA